MSTVQKLSRQADAGGETQRTITPKGWGRPATAAGVGTAGPQPSATSGDVGTTGPQNTEEQRERIQQTLAGGGDHEGPSPAERARAAFSPEIRAKLDGSAPAEAAPTGTVAEVPSQETATASPATPDVPKATRQRRASSGSVEAVGLSREEKLQLLTLVGWPNAQDAAAWLTAA